ncbi:BCCT family transporter [Desulfotalea psychrophila]|uniref:Probable transport protein n=1 Tax=Desulfotalea psychrophila (strain LSv54 / DSM 12343) TaxID=177439 RepID=Q6AMH4_DESPS|nr:BCCT family transporter [Desulfotalea psychrophila]CAG36451.1 probable transport protein [Desulfotalea psychrophila LSv54]
MNEICPPEENATQRNICYTSFFWVVFLVISSCLPLLLAPKASAKYIGIAFHFITNELGWLYMLAGLVSFIFVLWLAFGPLGDKKLGEEKEYSTFSWIGMLICAGVGAGVLFGGAIEWAYYMSYPLQGETVGSKKAIEWAGAYGLFHWGPVCWAIYATLAVPMAYNYYVKKVPILNIAQTCKGVLGERANHWPGKVINIFFMAGLVAGSATALGIGVPVIAACLVSVFGFAPSFQLEFLTLLGITMLFCMTSYLGLKNGLSKLSDLNVYAALFLLLFVLIVGPSVFIIETSLASLGLLTTEIVRMATWMDPSSETSFVKDWTVFYYAWFVAYAPFMGLFIAKISRGRTVREVVLGPVILASLGCGLFYLIFGNFGLHLQLTGQLDVVELVKTNKGATVIMQIADFLPWAPLYKLLYALVMAISMATTLDAVSFALSASTTKQLQPDEEPAHWNRLFWAIVLGFIPTGMLFIDGPLSILQTASIVVGLPVLFIIWLGVYSFLKDYLRDGWLTD